MIRISQFLIVAVLPTMVQSEEKLTPSVLVESGPVNSVVLNRQGARLAIYGLPDGKAQPCEYVLLTHHRRDVVWAARKLIDEGAQAVAPLAERALLETPEEFWNDFTSRRFHDYRQQSTKVIGRPLPVTRWVRDGDTIDWRGLTFRVLDTPGYTRGSLTYVVDIDDIRIAFSGDLIYGDGRLIDLYSFQDAIPEANILGYHGYGARLSQLISSLEKIDEQKPDLLVPARGPMIRNPHLAIQTLISKVKSVYRNYLSINALHWYFGDRMDTCAKRVLGDDAKAEEMDFARHEKSPDWVWEKGTSRLLVSDDGHGFLIDCHNQQILDALRKIMSQGLVTKIDGIFVTHYHDDHTDAVHSAAGVFNCPVYAVETYQDILARPEAYHMPAMTANAIEEIRVMENGETISWREFELTFHVYPGQAYYHGAMMVKKQNEISIFFIGDSFSPSGIDDYCMLNRNLIHEDQGYLLCINKLRQIEGDYWLVNQHIPYVFTFSTRQLDHLESRYRQRIAMLKALFPWDDPNYGIDEQWAVFYPYGAIVKRGAHQKLEVRIINHSPRERTFAVKPHAHCGLEFDEQSRSITIAARQMGRVSIDVRAMRDPGNYIVTADVQSDGMEFREWVEALIKVE